MPLVSSAYNPVTGPIIQIGIVQATPDMIAGEAPPVMDTVPNLFSALIDTGASVTCITQRVVQEVGLLPIGKALMQGATGSSEVNLYQFGVGFIIGNTPEPTGIMATMQTMIVDGMQFDGGESSFDVLIGRDIICRGSFSLSFDGHMILAF